MANPDQESLLWTLAIITPRQFWTCSGQIESMSKRKYSRGMSLKVALEVSTALHPHRQRLVIAGSNRRNRPYVGDVEPLNIPRLQNPLLQEDFVGETMVVGILTKRKNRIVRYAFGPKQVHGPKA